MYKVVDKTNYNAVYAIGYDKTKLQARIDTEYFHQYLMPELKHVELVVIESK